MFVFKLVLLLETLQWRVKGGGDFNLGDKEKGRKNENGVRCGSTTTTRQGLVGWWSLNFPIWCAGIMMKFAVCGCAKAS